MRPNNQDTFQSIMKVGKRVAITIVVCIPFMVLFAYFTRNVIKSNFVQIICFMAIMAVAVTIVEIIARRKEKVKKETEIEKRDVFK